LPWIGWAASGLADADARRGRARAASALALSIAACALAGQLGLLVDAVVLAIAIAGRRASWRWLAAGCAAGLAIGAFQWWPAISAIAAGAGSRVDGIALGRVLELVVPGSFGSSSPDHAVEAIAGSHPWAPSLYLGAPLVALGAIGRGGRRVGAVAAMLGVLALVVGRGGWPAWVGAPELHVGALAILAAAHAGTGVDALLAGERRALRTLAIAAAVAAMALAGIAGLRSDHDELARALDGALVDGGLGIFCMAASIAVVWRAPRWRAPVLLCLLVAPSVGATHSVAPTTSSALVTTLPEWARAAAVVSPPRRLDRNGPLFKHGETLEDAIATLAGTSSALWGIAAARSEDPARPTAHDATWVAGGHEGDALYDRLGIALAVFPPSVVAAQHLDALGSYGNWVLARVPVSTPAAVYQQWEWAAATSEARERLYPTGGGARGGRQRLVLAGQGAPSQEGGAPAPCAIERWEPGAIDLQCDTPAPAYAAVTSTPAPGWSAYVDDREVSWVTADVLRRAVALPAGTHRVRWRYAAPGQAPAEWLAGLGIAAIVALWLLGRRHASADASNVTS
jgi:hypothetical protein